MGDKSAIEWTDATWNPVTGCTKVSAGCKHCYAEGVAERFWAKQYPAIEVDTTPPAHPEMKSVGYRPRNFTDVMCHPERLDQPLRWKRARRIFVNSMSDLFHEDVDGHFLVEVFAVMALAPQHTFQVLTKRPARMLEIVNDDVFRDTLYTAITMRLEDEDRPASLRWDPLARRTDDARATAPDVCGNDWPLRNVWLGVSCEDQATADERIPLLLQTPAAVRFVSAEPLLGPINFKNVPGLNKAGSAGQELLRNFWIIVGGESGPGARPFDVQWARSIVAQCEAAGVPVFVKQLGGNTLGWCYGNAWGDALAAPDSTSVDCQIWEASEGAACPPGKCGCRLNRKGGDINEWPLDLRVREFPQ